MKKKVIYISRKFNHPARDSLLIDPPKNIEFLRNESVNPIEPNISGNDKSLGFLIKIRLLFKSIYGKIFDILRLPIIKFGISFGPYNYFLETFGLNISNKKVIIYQLESIADLVGYNFKKLKSRLGLTLIRLFLLSNRCKYVFCMSKASRESALELLGVPIKRSSKFQVIYPTKEPFDVEREKSSSIIKLLFISSIHKSKADKDFNFFMKGGKLVLQAYEHLIKKYPNIEMHYKGDIPENFKRRYEHIKNIFFYSTLPYEELMDLYKKSDIFIFPTYGDTFGYTFVEAMAYGLPVVTINNNFATPELIIDNENGYVVKTSLRFLKYPFGKIIPDWISEEIWYNNLKTKDDQVGLRGIIESLEKLIKNKDIREKFSKNAKKRLIDGDLSIKYKKVRLMSLFKE